MGEGDDGTIDRSGASGNLGAGGPSGARVLAGFWEKAGAWALPRDRGGEGFARLLRTRADDIGFCALFVFASGWGQTFLLSIFQPHWRAALGLSAAEMGALYGATTLAGGLLLPAAGRWLDRTGSGVAAGVTLAGLTVAALLVASSTHIAVFTAALFLLRFFGQGVSTNVGMTRAARWFERDRGKAVGLAGLGFPLGEALLPIVVTSLIAWFGWRGAWIALAVLSAGVLAPAARLLLARRRAKRGRVQAGGQGAREPARDRGGLLRDWRFHAMLAVSAPVPFVGTGVIFFQGGIAEVRGWSPAVFPTGFLVFAVVRAFVSLSAGAWADRIGAVRLLAVPALVFAAGLGCLAQPSPVFTYVFFALLGVAFGASSGVTTSAWAELFGSRRIGLIKGLSGSVAVFLTAGAPVVFGWALEAGFPLEAILWTCAGGMVALAGPAALALGRAR